MRYLLLACVLSGVLLASGATPEQDLNFSNGNDFLRVCETNGDHTFDGFCRGYVGGVIDGFDCAAIVGQAARHETMTGAFCIPAEVTLGQKYRVATKFMRDHPEKTHEPTNLLIVQAITEAFPCAKVSGKPQANK